MPQDEVSAAFRQNPLVDTDYTFAKSPDGRYCMVLRNDRRWLNVNRVRVYGTIIVMVFLSSSPCPNRKTHARSELSA